ncbi:MAG: CoA-binding protein [Planctomycetota bacterium]|jgi:predicted CoA-binding protein
MPSVAVIGASQDRRKFGNKAVRAYLQQGWTVHPVNPAGGEIEGLPVAANVRDVPAPVDRIALYLPPDVGMSLLADIAAVAHDEFIVNPGAESEALVARARALGLEPWLTCAIVEIGVSPSTL